ncbi:Uncharacterized membrane anchored protein Mext_4159 [hydrothermal vent metagenome]|uniref:Uncharacterized membrane anchored protein Mext_4159 n=1 Tax=hydrothermal vent metagenome TaxID=652676 RepID=A0A3B1ABQ5_9ZZZZ
MKRYLIAGLLVWVPLGVTVMVIKLLVDLMDRSLLLLPEPYRPDNLLGFHVPGLGVVLTTIIVLVTGMVVANLFGRKLVKLWESVLAQIPLVRTIYTGVKQILETVFSSNKQSFRKVLLVEYPRRGLWTLAFQSSTIAGEAQTKTGRVVVNVFIPTTPNPTSGFFIMVPSDDVVELDMSVDDGLKMIISAGVLVPKWSPTQLPDNAKQPARPDADSAA